MKQILYYKLSMFFEGLSLHTVKWTTAAFTDALVQQMHLWLTAPLTIKGIELPRLRAKNLSRSSQIASAL